MSDLVSIRPTELNQRRILFPAVLLTAAGATLTFILSRAFLIDQDFIGSIYENGVSRSLAGFFLLLFPYIYQRWAGKRRSNFWHLPDEAVPFDAYTLPWYVVLTYGILIAFALAGLSLFFVWLIGLATSFFVTRAISIITWIILLITFYFIGFWAGTRNTQSPFLVAIGIVLGYIVVELLLTSLLSIDSPLQGIFGLIVFLVPSLVSILIGTRAGKRRCLSNYVQFLLTFLPKQDRQVLVNNLYREVKQRTTGEN